LRSIGGGKYIPADVVAKAPLGKSFDCRQTYLPQACRVAFAAASRLNDAGRDIGINCSGLCGVVDDLDRRIKGFAHIARHLVIERTVFGLDER